MSSPGSYLAFTDFLKQFYPTILKSYTPSGQKIIAVFVDEDTITGVLDDTFILRKMSLIDSTNLIDSPELLSKMPVLIGLSPEDTLYLKKIIDKENVSIQASRIESASISNSNKKVVFHKGELGLDELVFVEADDNILKNAANIFLGRKGFLEKTIRYLLESHKNRSIIKDLAKYYSDITKILSNVSLTDQESDKIISHFDKEREFVENKLKMVKQQIELLKSDTKRLSLLNPEQEVQVIPQVIPTTNVNDNMNHNDNDNRTKDGNMTEEEDADIGGPVKIIEQLLKRLDKTREGFLRTVEDRKSKRTDMDSIRYILQNNATIRDNIHHYHLNAMNAINEIRSEEPFGYNVIKAEMIGDVKSVIRKFDMLRVICKNYPSHFNKTDCTRLEQYLQDYKIEILKNLNEHLSQLNTKKEELDNKRESRRLRIQDEIQHIKDIIRQKIKEIETMVELNNSKIDTYTSEITKDKLYNYANCSGVLKYYKQVRSILHRTQMIFDKCRDLLDVLCTDKSAVRKDLISTLSPEQKTEHCATLEQLVKSLNDVNLLFSNVLGSGVQIEVETSEIDIDTCTKISDYLLIWIEHSPKLRDIHDEVVKLLSNLN